MPNIRATNSAEPTATALIVNDRIKLKRYLGMDHIFEIYGSTEAVITTANRPGDPADSVGRVDSSIHILDEEGRECARYYGRQRRAYQL